MFNQIPLKETNSVKKTVLTFGLISGAVSIGILLATVHYIGSTDFRKEDILGYTSIVLSALVVFFGIRSYRENAGAGQLTFLRGVAVGLLITLVSCACYMVTFQIIYFKTTPDIGEKYAACMVERVRASGASQQKVDEMAKQARSYKQMYDNPVTNAALTFAEVYPIGLVVSLLSAGILRKKGAPREN
jgi:hypothetical protein